MKSRPILFSGAMVRAILAGRKTQTRRVVEPAPTDYGLDWREDEYGFCAWQDGGLLLDEHSAYGGPCQRVCPYGRPGDRLWVRETWALLSDNNCDEDGDGYVYRADGQPWDEMEGWRWRPSIHMPRDACRLTLEITGVRVERLNSISIADIMAEGTYHNRKLAPQVSDDPWCNFEQAWIDLWDSINAKRGCAWDADPWVWVIEFERCAEEEDNQ